MDVNSIEDGLLREFEEMVRRHDLTFEFSDDHSVWQKGSRQKIHIYEYAKFLNEADAIKIWNQVVDEKIIEGAREQFYWHLQMKRILHSDNRQP